MKSSTYRKLGCGRAVQKGSSGKPGRRDQRICAFEIRAKPYQKNQGVYLDTKNCCLYHTCSKASPVGPVGPVGLLPTAATTGPAADADMASASVAVPRPMKPDTSALVAWGVPTGMVPIKATAAAAMASSGPLGLSIESLFHTPPPPSAPTPLTLAPEPPETAPAGELHSREAATQAIVALAESVGFGTPELVTSTALRPVELTRSRSYEIDESVNKYLYRHVSPADGSKHKDTKKIVVQLHAKQVRGFVQLVFLNVPGGLWKTRSQLHEYLLGAVEHVIKQTEATRKEDPLLRHDHLVATQARSFLRQIRGREKNFEDPILAVGSTLHDHMRHPITQYGGVNGTWFALRHMTDPHTPGLLGAFNCADQMILARRMAKVHLEHEMPNDFTATNAQASKKQRVMKRGVSKSVTGKKKHSVINILKGVQRQLETEGNLTTIDLNEMLVLTENIVKIIHGRLKLSASSTSMSLPGLAQNSVSEVNTDLTHVSRQ